MPGLGVSQPSLPPADPLANVARVVRLLALGDLRRARVAPVANRVDEPRLGEDPRQGRRGGDREAAHLDQGWLARLGRQRRQEVVEELARGRRRVLGNPGLESPCRRLQPLAGEDLVEAADLAVVGRLGDRAAQERPRANQDPLAQARPSPPEAAQLGRERLGSRVPLHQVREPAGVAVKPAFDRDHVEMRVVVEDVGHHVGAASPGAADEDQAHRQAPSSIGAPRYGSGGSSAAEAAAASPASAASRERSKARSRSGAELMPADSKRPSVSS